MEEFVKVTDLPASLMDGIVCDLAAYSIGFLRLQDTSQGQDAFLLGSGTLVEIGSTRAILTAHHVIQVLTQRGRLGILLSPTLQPHTIDTQGVTYLKIARGDVDSTGPDLGAVLLAPHIAGAIAAKKIFYNLDLRRERLLHHPPDSRDGVWFVHGFLNEKTVRQPATNEDGPVTSFYSFSGAAPAEPVCQIGSHDYFTCPVSPTARPMAPSSFGGMSGGGLWQVELTRDDQGNLVHKTPLLSGVVFYQEATEAGCSVKCHGRTSLYRIAYDAIAHNEP